MATRAKIEPNLKYLSQIFPIMHSTKIAQMVLHCRTKWLTDIILETNSFNRHLFLNQAPKPEVIKLFSCSTQMSTKFQLLIKIKILINEEVPCCKSLKCCIYHDNKCLNANNCWHFNIYEQYKFCAQLS